MRTITFCIPVYDDDRSLGMLLPMIGQAAIHLTIRATVFVVDDGSSEALALPAPPPGIDSVTVIGLRRNLGHQRAIAVGLAAIAAETPTDAVVVMDGDGEDRPDSVGQLIARAEHDGWRSAVFAERMRRHDGAGFMLGYRVFRLLHIALVGRDIRFGNFSLLPWPVLQRVVGIAEIWNHYAAAVLHARIPVVFVPIDRGRRLAGTSKMNFPALVMHGICALSVWSDIVVARTFIVVGLLLAATIGLLTSLAVGNAFVPGASGWATIAAVMLIVIALLLGVFGILMALFVLGSRSGSTFLPLRDWRFFVLTTHRIAATIEGAGGA
jgi:glycosyltransferase involved in cell wall biosynthesis